MTPIVFMNDFVLTCVGGPGSFKKAVTFLSFLDMFICYLDLVRKRVRFVSLGPLLDQLLLLLFRFCLDKGATRTFSYKVLSFDIWVNKRWKGTYESRQIVLVRGGNVSCLLDYWLRHSDSMSICVRPDNFLLRPLWCERPRSNGVLFRLFNQSCEFSDAGAFVKCRCMRLEEVSFINFLIAIRWR